MCRRNRCHARRSRRRGHTALAAPGHLSPINQQPVSPRSCRANSSDLSLVSWPGRNRRRTMAPQPHRHFIAPKGAAEITTGCWSGVSGVSARRSGWRGNEATGTTITPSSASPMEENNRCRRGVRSALRARRRQRRSFSALLFRWRGLQEHRVESLVWIRGAGEAVQREGRRRPRETLLRRSLGPTLFDRADRCAR